MAPLDLLAPSSELIISEKRRFVVVGSIIIIIIIGQPDSTTKHGAGFKLADAIHFLTHSLSVTETVCKSIARLSWN